MTQLDPIHVPVFADDKGYYDRQCPNPDCEFVFKVNLEDWSELFSDEAVYCPQCGRPAPSDQWYTLEQCEAIRETATSAALGWIHDELESCLRDLEWDSRSNGLVKIGLVPTPRPEAVITPITQIDAWETDHCCVQCHARFSTKGNTHFCPCCGKKLLIDTYLDTLETKRQQISKLDDIEASCAVLLSEDGARKMRLQLEESTLIELVAGFQAFAEALYEKLGGSSVARNQFQRINQGSDAFFALTGVSYESIVGDDVQLMRIMFQRRHLLEHRGGIVDEEYLRYSGDTGSLVGERVVVCAGDILSFIEVLNRLGMGLLCIGSETVD